MPTEQTVRKASKNTQLKDDALTLNCGKKQYSSSTFWGSKTKAMNTYPDLNNPDCLISSKRLKALFTEQQICSC